MTTPRPRAEFLNGWNAQARGLPHDGNPYDEATQSFSWDRWSDGYLSRERHMAMKEVPWFDFYGDCEE